MPRQVYWTDERKAILKESYESGGASAALLKFPNHKVGALFVAANAFGFKAPARQGRSVALRSETIAKRRAAREAAAQEKERLRQQKTADRLARREQTLNSKAIRKRKAAYDAAIARAQSLFTAITILDRMFAPSIVIIETEKLRALAAAPPTAAPQPTSVPPSPGATRLEGGVVDRGAIEHVRRRLANYVIPELARDLHVPALDIVATIAMLAKRRFERDALGKLNCDPEDSIVGVERNDRTYVQKQNRR